MFICFFSIWAGCFFGIYFHFLRDYTQATCTLDAYSENMFSSYLADGDALYWYRQLYLTIEIEGKEYVGFGCESDAQHLPTVVTHSPFGSYAYQTIDCEYWNNCTFAECRGGQQIQPRCLCNDWYSNTPYNIGDKFECWYAVTKGF